MSKRVIPNSLLTATRISAVSRAGWHTAAVLAGLVLWFHPAPGARAAQSSEPARGPSYSDFRIISERNIFNPQRSARTSGQSERRETRRSSTPTDYVALVGTMSYEKGWHAFFEGSRSDFRKVLRPGDSIAGHRLAAIGLKEVVLTSGTNEFVLPVGKQLRRETEGEWRVADAPERPITSYAASSSSSSSSYSRSSSFAQAPTPPPPPPVAAPPGGPEVDPAGPIPMPTVVVDPDTGVIVTAPGADTGTTNGVTPAPAGGSESDVLRRLMQRREEELNR
jgi:hypothetical protein